ncbi:MAG: hypothetical protein ABEH65_12430 [Halobacteriales archaeon]
MEKADELTTELNVTGELDEEISERAPIIRLMEDVLEHGEVHAEFADDSNRYVEIRKGTTTFDFQGGVFVVNDGITDHQFAMSLLTNWHKPRNVFEEAVH